MEAQIISLDRLTNNWSYKAGYVILKDEKIKLVDFFRMIPLTLVHIKDHQVLDHINKKVKRIYLDHQKECSSLICIAKQMLFKNAALEREEEESAYLDCLQSVEREWGKSYRKKIKESPSYKEKGSSNLKIVLNLGERTIFKIPAHHALLEKNSKIFKIPVHHAVLKKNSKLYNELFNDMYGAILDQKKSVWEIPLKPSQCQYTHSDSNKKLQEVNHIFGVSIKPLLILIEYFYSNHLERSELAEVVREASYLQGTLRGIPLADVLGILKSEHRNCVWDYALELTKNPLEEPDSPDAQSQIELLNFLYHHLNQGPEKARVCYLLGKHFIQISSQKTSDDFNPLPHNLQGIAFLEMAANENHADAMWELHEYYKTRDQNPTAQHWFKLAVIHDHPQAICLLALQCTSGKGEMKKDLKKAEELFLKAEALGDVSASNYLGLLYGGEKTDKSFEDFPKALEHFKIGAQRGNKNCLFNIGAMYEHGLGDLPLDYLEAIRYYEMAAKQDLERGRERALLLKKKYDIDNFFNSPQFFYDLAKRFRVGDKVRVKNVKEAKIHYLKAIDRGSSVAAYELGEMYEKGELPKNLKHALKYYKIAAKLGSASSYLKVGSFFENGLGTNINIRKALKYYQQSMKMGFKTLAKKKILNLLNEVAEGMDFDAMWELYLFHLKEGNDEEAAAWLQKAANNDHSLALSTVNLLNKAVLEKSADAMWELFLFFADKKLRTQALKWVKMAAENQHEMAPNALDFLQKAENNDADAIGMLYLLFSNAGQVNAAEQWQEMALKNNHSLEPEQNFKKGLE